MPGRRRARVPRLLTAAVIVTAAVAVGWVWRGLLADWLVSAREWLRGIDGRAGAALKGAAPMLSWLAVGFVAVIAVLLVWRSLPALRRGGRHWLARRAGPGLTIGDIDRIDDRQFEFLVGELWRAQGFAVDVTQRGISDCDVVARRGELTIAIDAKHRIEGAVVDVQEVLKVPGYMAKYQAAGGTVRGAVVTNRDFAKPAREAVGWTHEVELIDRDGLMALLAEYPVARAALRAAMGEWRETHKGGTG